MKRGLCAYRQRESFPRQAGGASCWLWRRGLCQPSTAPPISPAGLPQPESRASGPISTDAGPMMLLSPGSAATELNRVTGNLCLQPAPWGESPASWHCHAERIHFPWQAPAWQGPRSQPAGYRASLHQHPGRPSPETQALFPALQTGHWLNPQHRHCSSSALASPGSLCGSLEMQITSAGPRTVGQTHSGFTWDHLTRVFVFSQDNSPVSDQVRS